MKALVRIELTLDEIDLVSATVCRDRDRVLDVRFGYRGTRLLSDREASLVPVHQEVLSKIERALNGVRGTAADEAIDAVAGHDGPSVRDLGKVRGLCEAFSIDALRVAIDVHRSSCHQADCPVLAVMVATAEVRS